MLFSWDVAIRLLGRPLVTGQDYWLTLPVGFSVAFAPWLALRAFDRR
jgi:hypothetical protein